MAGMLPAQRKWQQRTLRLHANICGGPGISYPRSKKFTQQRSTNIRPELCRGFRIVMAATDTPSPVGGLLRLLLGCRCVMRQPFFICGFSHCFLKSAIACSGVAELLRL